MVSFLHERQMLRQIIGEMEAALAQPAVPPAALAGWQATFREITDRIEASPDDPDNAAEQATGGVRHLHERAHQLLAELMRGR